MTVKNEKVFIEKTEESAINIVRIAEEYRPEFAKLKKLFKMSFGKDGKMFKFLNDLQYYKGGYPKEETPPKIKTLLDNIATAFNFAELRGKEDIINGYLKSEYGIEIKPITGRGDMGMAGLSGKKKKKFDELWRSVFNDDYKNESPKEIYAKLIEAGQSLEASICHDKDDVMVNNASFVEAECEISKASFMAAVNMKAVEIRKGDDAVSDKLNEINVKRQEFDTAIETIMPEGEKS